MKKAVICTILLWGVLSAHGQIKFEAQVGGSNFLGLTFNTAFDFKLTENGNHYIVPTIGMGVSVPSSEEPPASIVHFGLNYRYKKWGLGIEVSGFTNSPFWGKSYTSSYADIIIYPNANYTFQTKTNWYYKVSAGLYYAYSEKYDLDQSKYFERRVVPGPGFSVGYKF